MAGMGTTGLTMKGIRGRIYVFHEDGWQIGDSKTGMCLCLRNKTEAENAARFCRFYIRKWGDINLGSFPYSYDEPLRPFCWCGNDLPCDTHPESNNA